jgi:hypothetical protein
MFVFVAIVFYLFNRKLLIALYIILLPTDGIFFAEYNIVGILNINVAINFFTTIVFLPELFKKHKLIASQKIPIYIIYAYIFYLIFVNFKNAYIGLMSLEQSINRSIYFFLEYLPLVALIKIIKKQDLTETIKYSFYFSSIFLTISALLSPYLINYGFKIGAEQGLEIFSLNRYGGLYGKGDENSFGIFSAMIVGFLLSIYENRKINYYEIIVFLSAILGVLLSGSRAAIISLVIVSLYYVKRNFSSGKSFKIIFFFGIISILLAPQIGKVLVRFETFSTQLETETSSNRIGKWILYVNHMFENPSIFLYGNEKIFSLTSYETRRAAHNLYVQIVYDSGLLPFFLLIYGYLKYFLFSLKNKFLLKPFYYLFPIFMETMSVSAFSLLAYVALIIAINGSVNNKKLII